MAMYELLITKFSAWANAQLDIRAAIIVGSQARTDHPADAWADLDILTYATDPNRYEKPNWLADIGTVWAKARQRTFRGDLEWLVTFAPGLDVDFVFFPSGRTRRENRSLIILQKIPQLKRALPKRLVHQIEHELPVGARMLARGYRVLLDRDALIAQTQRAYGPALPPLAPTEKEFLEFCELFWCAAERQAKKIQRGELYVAHTQSLQPSLLQLMEWHTLTMRGRDYDVWHGGRFLEEWVDAKTLAELKKTYARYDQNEMRSALLATLKLFRRLGVEIARNLGYRYPTDVDAAMTDLINRMFGQPIERPKNVEIRG
jgi:aminoglycoside 6-adenylyltransferase